MIMTAKDGKPMGSEPDIARDLAKKLGVEVAFIRTADTYGSGRGPGSRDATR